MTERISRDRDIILEAISTYDTWMEEDVFDHKRVLDEIISRMKWRLTFGESPALAALDAEPEVKVRAPVRWPSAGDKMRFLAENGYDFELAAAKEIFQKGDVVTVRKCDVGSFSHTIWFEGHEQGFNGVMFELLPPESRS